MPDLETLVEIIKALPCETQEDIQALMEAAAEVRASEQYSPKDKKRLLAVISERTSERLGKLRADQERALAGLVDLSTEADTRSAQQRLDDRSGVVQALLAELIREIPLLQGAAYQAGVEAGRQQAKGTKPKKKRG